MARIVSLAGLLSAVLFMSACGGGGGGGGGGSSNPPPPPPSVTAPSALSYTSPQVYTAGTAITALAPTVTGTVTTYTVSPALPAGLQLAANGQISGTPVAAATQTTYVVTAANSGGSTTFNLVITVNGAFTVGGTVSGLTGAGLILSNNGGDDLPITNNGGFTFTQSLNGGAAYAVTVATQPAGQTCSVAQASGNIGSANITNIAVTCTAIVVPTYSIGGTVMGLTGSPVVLLNNGGDSLTVGANGGFTFATELATGANYSVAVGTQPTGLTCQVSAASGAVGSADVTNIVVACSGTTATMGGTVLGLAGTGLKIHNGLSELTINANGAFTYPDLFGAGINYHVRVSQAPSSPAQTCAVLNGIGTTTTTAIKNIGIICVNTPPAGRFVYVPNFTGANISAWSVNQTTGTLSAVVGGPFAAGAQLTQLVAHPSGKFLYGRATADNNIRAFAIDQSNTPTAGALTAVAGSPFAVGGNASNVTIDRSGKWLIVTSSTAPSISVFAIDGTTGVLTQVPGSPYTTSYTPGSVVFRPDSKFVYVADPSGNELNGFSIDATSGALTALSTPFFTSNSISEMAIDALGRFLYASTLQGTMYLATIDNITGALTPIGAGNPQVGSSPRTVVIDPLGRFLYVVLSPFPDPGAVAQFTINQTTGMISTTGSSPTVGTGIGALQTGLAMRPDGRFIYTATLFTDLLFAFEVDSTNGQLYAVPGHPQATDTGPNPPTMDPAGRFVYVSSAVNNNLSVYSTDLLTGTLTPVPGSPFPAGLGPIGQVVVP